MDEMLTFLHSLGRWLVLAGIISAMVIASWRAARRLPFNAASNAVRHWSATIAHIQLLLGMLLYFRSPSLKRFWSDASLREGYSDLRFFALIHPLCMLGAIIALTIGSALAKRTADAQRQYRILLRWYGAVLLLMLFAIPWPFSPLAARPYFRKS